MDDRICGSLPFVLIAGLALGGCGAGRSSRGVTPPQFASRAEAICVVEVRKLDYIRGRAALLGASAVLRREAAASQVATAGLEALRRPPRERRGIEAWLIARTVAATVAKDLAEAPLAGAERAVADVARELGRRRARVRALVPGLAAGACDGAI